MSAPQYQFHPLDEEIAAGLDVAFEDLEDVVVPLDPESTAASTKRPAAEPLETGTAAPAKRGRGRPWTPFVGNEGSARDFVEWYTLDAREESGYPLVRLNGEASKLRLKRSVSPDAALDWLFDEALPAGRDACPDLVHALFLLDRTTRDSKKLGVVLAALEARGGGSRAKPHRLRLVFVRALAARLPATRISAEDLEQLVGLLLPLWTMDEREAASATESCELLFAAVSRDAERRAAVERAVAAWLYGGSQLLTPYLVELNALVPLASLARREGCPRLAHLVDEFPVVRPVPAERLRTPSSLERLAYNVVKNSAGGVEAIDACPARQNALFHLHGPHRAALAEHEAAPRGPTRPNPMALFEPLAA